MPKWIQMLVVESWGKPWETHFFAVFLPNVGQFFGGEGVEAQEVSKKNEDSTGKTSQTDSKTHHFSLPYAPCMEYVPTFTLKITQLSRQMGLGTRKLTF